MNVMEISKPLQSKQANPMASIAGYCEFAKDVVQGSDCELRSATKGAGIYSCLDQLQPIVNKVVVGAGLGSQTMLIGWPPRFSLTGQSQIEKVSLGAAKLRAGGWYGMPRLHECIRVSGVSAIGRDIVEAMEEAKGKSRELRTDARTTRPQRRALQPAPELYPDLDFARIRARSTELRESTSSTAGAVGRIVGDSASAARRIA